MNACSTVISCGASACAAVWQHQRPGQGRMCVRSATALLPWRYREHTRITVFGRNHCYIAPPPLPRAQLRSSQEITVTSGLIQGARATQEPRGGGSGLLDQRATRQNCSPPLRRNEHSCRDAANRGQQNDRHKTRCGRGPSMRLVSGPRLPQSRMQENLGRRSLGLCWRESKKCRSRPKGDRTSWRCLAMGCNGCRNEARSVMACWNAQRRMRRNRPASIGHRMRKVALRLIGSVNLDLAVRTIGGYSLLVLAE